MNLLRRFSILLASALVVLGVLLGFVIARILEGKALESARGDLARHIRIEASHILSPGDLSAPVPPEAFERFRARLADVTAFPNVASTSLHSARGFVVWSDDRDRIGRSSREARAVREAFAGKASSAIIDARAAFRPGTPRLREGMELFVPFSLGNSVAVDGVFEVLLDIAPLRAEIRVAKLKTWGVLAAGFLLLYILLFGIVRRGTVLIHQSRLELDRSRERIRSQRLELLGRIGASALQESDLGPVLTDAAADICRLLELPRCSIRLSDPENRVVEHCEPGYPSAVEAFACLRELSDPRPSLRTEERVVVRDVRESATPAVLRDGMERLRLGAWVGIPLRIQERTVGALFVDAAGPRNWSDDEIATIEAVGRQVSVAVRHIRLFNEQQDLAGRLLSLMNNVPGAMYRGRKDWSVTFIGKDVARITGFAAEEIVSGAVRWRDRIHPLDLETVRATFREAVRKREKVLRVEYRMVHRNGECVWIADRRQLVYDADGSLLYVDGLILDITSRKQAEERLRLTQFAVDRAGDAAYWIRPDGRLVYVNERACRNLGYTREELLGMTIHEINPEFPVSRWAEHWEDLRRRKTYTMESRHRTRDGRLIPVEVTVNYVDTDGQEYNCAFARDITERLRAEEESRDLHAQLIQSQKMEAIGLLAGGVAHDFNNLLTGILGHASLLKETGLPVPETAKAADVIQALAERAARLTSQLLGFARKGKNRAVPIDVNATIENVAGLLSRTLDKRILVVKDLHPSRLVTVGDPSQIEQVIMNLAMNGCDAMKEGGELRFETGTAVFDESSIRSGKGTVPGRYAVIRVVDAGVGIPPEYLGKIFDPFFTTKEQGKGTGLGLSMVFGIIKNHGGHVDVRSRVGIGTTFEVFLPLSAAPMEEAARPEAQKPVALGRCSGKILLVDDEEPVRQVCTAMLTALGYEVVTAVDGSEGAQIYHASHQEIDLVILDMMMPKLNGRDCFRVLKRINPDVRAILATGYSLEGAVQETMDEGILGFIQKPYRLEQLARIVEKVMARPPLPPIITRTEAPSIH